MCSKICFALLLVASLHTANGQFFSNLVSSFSSSIQNAFGGNRAPVPPGGVRRSKSSDICSSFVQSVSVKHNKSISLKVWPRS